ncbi:hypothetical protein [Streptomyces silvensis]|uniref:hypothetical protein n=1 Tax=Streptomyces silvensis TaxID=1765722 RepID=UPI0012FEB978|nr:hypothetical protein [Streptomyces silvensis]
MWSRARLVWCSLAGVLVVVLGVGVLCGTAAGGFAGVTSVRAEAGAGASVRAASVPQAGDLPGVPGCGRGQGDDAQRPAAPPRFPSSYELLPALYDNRADASSWGVDQTVLCLAPGRAPPALVSPSPIDLSVLRV